MKYIVVSVRGLGTHDSEGAGGEGQRNAEGYRFCPRSRGSSLRAGRPWERMMRL